MGAGDCVGVGMDVEGVEDSGVVAADFLNENLDFGGLLAASCSSRSLSC